MGIGLQKILLIPHVEMALEDYISYLDNWLIEQQWSSLEGLDI
jgi:hypothetical protein